MNVSPLPYADVAAAAGKILTQTREQGGGTFDFKGNLLPTPCFVVGGAGEELIFAVDDEEAQTRLANYMQRQPIKGHNIDKGLLGTWIHDGKVYVDRVTLHDTLIAAVSIGYQRGELAIWDGENNTEIILTLEVN